MSPFIEQHELASHHTQVNVFHETLMFVFWLEVSNLQNYFVRIDSFIAALCCAAVNVLLTRCLIVTQVFLSHTQWTDSSTIKLSFLKVAQGASKARSGDDRHILLCNPVQVSMHPKPPARS